jgi:hypothetical protein
MAKGKEGFEYLVRYAAECLDFANSRSRLVEAVSRCPLRFLCYTFVTVLQFFLQQ